MAAWSSNIATAPPGSRAFGTPEAVTAGAGVGMVGAGVAPDGHLWSAEQLDRAQAVTLAVLEDVVLLAQQPIEGLDQRHVIELPTHFSGLRQDPVDLSATGPPDIRHDLRQ